MKLINQKKVIGIKICFDKESDVQGLNEYLVQNNLLGFVPLKMHFNGDEMLYDKQLALKEINRLQKSSGVIYKDIEEINYLVVGFQGVIDSALLISFRVISEEITSQLSNAIEQITQINGFICCYIYDYWDEYWQSATFESDYEIYEQPHKHLKRTENQWGEEVIDTTKNYGKLEVLREVNIMAAPIMYFSKWYNDNICSFDKLKANYEYEELSNKILKIKLSNSVFEINRNEQKKFLNLIEIEKVREKFAVFSE